MAKGHAKTAKLYDKQTVSFRFDSDIAEQLASYVGRIKEEAMRPAVFAGITVLYDEMRFRAPIDKGDLRDSIYRWRVKQPTGDKVTFYVGVNKRKAPHWWLVEYGHWQYYVTGIAKSGPNAGKWVTNHNLPLAQPKFIPAEPYIRPTIDSTLALAMQTSLQELKKRIKAFNQAKNHIEATIHAVAY